MRLNIKKLYFLGIIGAVAFAGCNKKDSEINFATVAEFAASTAQPTANLGSYYIANDPNSVFKVPIGITTVSNVDRTINFTVTSPTGAVAGQQYTVASSSIVIPAGKVIDSIPVKGLFSGYPTGRKDTLVFTITSADVPISPTFNVYKLVLQKYCNVALTDLTGNYANTTDNDGTRSYGNYPTVVSATSTGPTSATLVIKNLGASYFGPYLPTDAASNPGITVNIDWSNPANFTTIIPTQNLAVIPPYGQATIKANGTGTFSSCDNTITLKYTVTVAAGSFGNFTTKLTR